SSVAGTTLNTGTSEQPLPDLDQRYAELALGSIDAPDKTLLTQTGFALERLLLPSRVSSHGTISGAAVFHGVACSS
ncbi:MAG TPA: hypothetical protein VK549_00250, partial [Acidimicrobiia bacterium]|nr:hypothetical protein [Acidimicrobiia bacterium]